MEELVECILIVMAILILLRQLLSLSAIVVLTPRLQVHHEDARIEVDVL